MNKKVLLTISNHLVVEDTVYSYWVNGGLTKMRVFVLRVKKQLKHSVEVITLRIKAMYKEFEGEFLAYKLSDISFVEEYQKALVPKKHLQAIQDHILTTVYSSL